VIGFFFCKEKILFSDKNVILPFTGDYRWHIVSENEEHEIFKYCALRKNFVLFIFYFVPQGVSAFSVLYLFVSIYEYFRDAEPFFPWSVLP